MSNRNVTPLLHKIRNFLLQREYVLNNRYADTCSPRDVPTPNLPPGISHKLSANYYYTRDGRRMARAPKEVLTGEALVQIEAGQQSQKLKEAAPAKSVARPGAVVPGNVFQA